MGFISVRMYNYLWGYTAAQVELLSADSPIVVYHREHRDAKGNIIPKKPKAVDLLRRKLAYEERMKRGEVKKSFDFSGYKLQK